MIIRPYEPSDAPALQRIAEDSGFPYEPLDSPLIEAALVAVDDEGNVLAGATAKRIPELYFYKSKGLSPAATKSIISAFHPLMRAKLQHLHYTGANIFLAPSICERFGRRLQRSWGWIKNWDSFAIRF